MTIIETAKLSGLNPEAYLADVLARINEHLVTRLDELLPWIRPAGVRPGGVSMATITHVFTIARVAEMLGVDEDRLHEIAIEMEPEDGVMHVYGIDDDGIMAFTDFGVENLRELLQTQQEDAVRDQAELAREPTMRS